MAVFEMADQPLPLAYCGSERHVADSTFVCIKPHCTGERHYYVKDES